MDHLEHMIWTIHLDDGPMHHTRNVVLDPPFGRSKITVVGRNFGLSKTMLV